MIRNFFKSTILAASMMLALATPALVTVPAYAQTSKSAACEGVALTGADCGSATAQSSVDSLVATVVNILSIIVGIAAVIMIIVGGFKYVASGGDANKVSSAKSTLIYAIVGLLIAVLAQFIVHFVLDNVGV